HHVLRIRPDLYIAIDALEGDAGCEQLHPLVRCYLFGADILLASHDMHRPATSAARVFPAAAVRVSDNHRTRPSSVSMGRALTRPCIVGFGAAAKGSQDRTRRRVRFV